MRRANHSPVTPLIVDRARDGAYVLHALTPDGVISLGSHASVADAWMAVDTLDSPAELLGGPAEQLAKAA